MKKFCAVLKKIATEILDYEEKETLPLKDKQIESYNTRKFCHICKKEFHEVGDSSYTDRDSDTHGEELDARKFHGDVAGLDDIDHYYDHDDDSNDEGFNARKFHRDATGLDDVDDVDDDDHDDQFDVKMFYGDAVGLDGCL